MQRIYVNADRLIVLEFHSQEFDCAIADAIHRIL